MTPRFRIAFAALLAGTAAQPALADQIVDNVEGIRIDEGGRIDRFEALVIDDSGRVRQVLHRGDKRPAKVQYRVDGQGRVLMPGLIDAHLHVMGLGLAALTLDLSETNSLDEALAKIAQFAKDQPQRPWIIGRGWNQEKWGLGRFPTAADLDRVVSDRPVWLERVDGHAGWANSLAMKAANITPGMPNPATGRIERIGKSLIPSGVFVDGATALVEKAVPEPRPADRDNALVEAQKILHRYGITAAADMGTTIEDWQAFRRAGDVGRLTLRIMSYAAGPDNMVLIGGPGPTPWLYDDRLRMNGVKLYLDGALGSRGAWLKQPYADSPGNTGLHLTDPAKYRNILVRAGLGNFQVATHAIGDGANAEALNAYSEVLDSFKGDRRWRIEHAQIVDPADMAKFGKFGIVASMQPVHQTSDRVMAEARLGPARLAGAYAWKSIAATGATLAFGSDAPVERPDPFAGLAAATTRADEKGQPFGGWQPQERVPIEKALAAYTSDAARAGFAEGHFGRLVAGERADFLLVDRDPLLASPSDLRATKVLETWVGGQKVFPAP